MRIIALVLVVACGKSERADDKVPAPKSSGGPAGSLASLKVSLEGAPLAVDRAFVRRVSADIYTVFVGQGEGSCEALLAGTDEHTGKSFAFTVARRVAPTGHDNWFVTDLWSRDFAAGGAKLPHRVRVDGTAESGTTTTIEVPSLQAGTLSVAGTLVAAGCGEGPAPTGVGVPKGPLQMRAQVVVAGRALPIRGVIVSARKGANAADLPNITISTNVKDCSEATLPAAVILERRDGAWSLRGTWFDAPIAGAADDTKELAFSANAVGKTADGPTLVLQLSGSGKLGDYTVKLGGTAEAIECVN